MRSRTLYMSVVAGGLIAAAVLLVYPVFKGEAQKASEQLKKQDADALEKLRENSLALRFYDKLGAQDSLVLLSFVPPSPVDYQKVVTMVFQKGGDEVSVNINEYDTVEGPKSRFNAPTNAVIEPYSDLGDQGKKIYSAYGKKEFLGLAYRKDRFYITISCRDEEMAKRLGGYALETINQ